MTRFRVSYTVICEWDESKEVEAENLSEAIRIGEKKVRENPCVTSEDTVLFQKGETINA